MPASPRHAGWALVAGDWLGGTVSSNGQERFKSNPTCPALPMGKDRHSIFIVTADIQGEIFPQKGVSGGGQSSTLLGLSHPVRV